MKNKRFFLWKKYSLLLFAAFFLILSSGCITSAVILYCKMKDADYLESWEDSDGTILKDILYDEEKKLTYDLYLPEAKIPKGEKVGAILFIHGGSWNSGSKEDISYAAKRFVKEGYVTVSLNYSLAGKNKPVTFFAMLEDIDKCLLHLKKTSAEYSYPITKIALSGVSAGGHLALLYSYTFQARSPIPIAFVFQQTGPTLFTEEAWKNIPGLAFDLTRASSGVPMTRKEYESGKMHHVIRSISPALLVNKNSPPTIGAYGAKDPLVIPLHAAALKKALQKYDVPHKWILYPNSGHFLCNDPEYALQYRKAVLSYCKKYFPVTRRK